jgi:hypothetical protein
VPRIPLLQRGDALDDREGLPCGAVRQMSSAMQNSAMAGTLSCLLCIITLLRPEKSKSRILPGNLQSLRYSMIGLIAPNRIIQKWQTRQGRRLTCLASFVFRVPATRYSLCVGHPVLPCPLRLALARISSDSPSRSGLLRFLLSFLLPHFMISIALHVGWDTVLIRFSQTITNSNQNGVPTRSLRSWFSPMASIPFVAPFRIPPGAFWFDSARMLYSSCLYSF